MPSCLVGATRGEVLRILEVSRKRHYFKQYRKRYEPPSRRVNCSLSRQEFRKLEAKAKKHQKKATTFLREAALAYVDQKYLVPENLEASFNKTLLEVRRIGRHINQIARHTNTIQKLTIFNAVKSQALLDKLEYKLKKLVKNPAKHGH